MIAFDAPDRPDVPCANPGIADWFISPLQADHQLAAVHCNKGRKYDKTRPECPFLVSCHQKVTAEIAASTGANSCVEGTWAGVLYGQHGKPGRPRKKAS